MRSGPERGLLLVGLQASLIVACAASRPGPATQRPNADTANQPSCPAPPVALSDARAVVNQYCVRCHSPNGSAGADYDYRSDTALLAHRRNIEAMLRLGAMPPRGVPQPPTDARRALLCWARSDEK